MSRDKLIALREYIEESLSKGFIRASSSPAGARVLFIKKGNESLWLCVNYKGINKTTVKDPYPLPLIQETLMRFSKVKWFTKLDLHGAYILVRMADGKEWKTSFRKYLDVFYAAYIDDILIYSDTLEDHRFHFRIVLKSHEKAGLDLKPEKYEFQIEKNQVPGTHYFIRRYLHGPRQSRHGQ